MQQFVFTTVGFDDSELEEYGLPGLVCHHFSLLKVFHWCPMAYSMPGECKACRVPGANTRSRIRDSGFNNSEFGRYLSSESLLLELGKTLMGRSSRLSSVLCRSITSPPFEAAGSSVDSYGLPTPCEGWAATMLDEKVNFRVMKSSE